MLITLLFMIVTLVKSRQRSSLKKKLQNIFKERKYSVSLCTVSQSELQELEDGTNESDGLPFSSTYASISPSVCSNFTCAEIKELLWYCGDDKELYTIYPTQRCEIHNWRAVLSEAESFLQSNPRFKISNKSESEQPQHFVVQAALDSWGCSTSLPSINLLDYGIIDVWTTRKKCVYFILETDIDHMTDFFSTLMQGQYCINNGLKLIRVLSILFVKRSVRSCTTTCLKDHKVYGGINHSDVTFIYDELFVNLCKTSSSLPPKEDASSPVIKKDGFFSFLKKDDSSCLEKDNLSVPSQDKATRESSSSSSKDDDIEDTEFSDSDKYEFHSDDSSEDAFISDEEKLFFSHKYSMRPKSPLKKAPRALLRFNFMIMIYAEREQDIHDVKIMLENVLQNPYRYCIYVLTKEDVDKGRWLDHVGLIIVVGNLNAKFIKSLVTSVTKGAKVLALCSNMLQTLLPQFKTAEVQENKLITFSYDKYKNINMVHDLFCYQASPVHARFSQENDDSRVELPSTIRVIDDYDDPHILHMTELGREETWQTPSILVLTLPEVYGTIVLSQIHLEKDPTQFANEKKNITVLEKSNEARFNIIRDLFEKQFELDLTYERVEYTIGYFLGLNQLKQKMMENLKNKIMTDGIIVMPKLKIEFCKTRVSKIPASSVFLPVLMYMCPAEFSTVSYYDNLKTESIGRLVIYSKVLMSSMYAIGTKLEHGLAVITREQTRGHGRHKDKTWLGPNGCAMFSVQVHIPRDSCLGCHITILQHVVTVAIITAVKQRPGYEDIPLQLKWPNDVYAYKKTKIGGVIITTQLEDSKFICNIGVGVNLDNNWPTMCINDMISKYNEEKQKEGNISPLKPLGYEEFIASVFNQLEILINKIQIDGSLTHFRDLYQKNWIHERTVVSVAISDSKLCKGKVVGIDNDGFLVVQKKNGEKHVVHPDGNSFDSLTGLIFPRERKIIQ